MTLWIVASQAPLSMGFSRQEYWSGLPRPPPGDLPKPGIEPTSVISLALAGGFFTISTTWEARRTLWGFLKKKTRPELPYDLAVPLLGISLVKSLTGKGNSQPNVRGSTAYNSQDTATT